MGGLTMGADFITAAAVMRAFQTGRTMVHGCIARKETKHGIQSKLENELPKGTRIVAVDDVVTSGGSTIKAYEEFVREGYDVVGVLAVVDRERGGIEELRRR